jgi:hypothetical protein
LLFNFTPFQGRLATYIEREISEEQAGFRKGRGTRDQIANIRWIRRTTRSNNPPIKVCYFGQVMTSQGSLERDIMLGQVAGYRRQGKPRMHWLDSIKEATGLLLEVSKETVQDRKKWCMLVEEKTRNKECTNVK